MDELEIIDRAIAHVEEYGFKGTSYGADRLPCCFIGVARIAAGCSNGIPRSTPTVIDGRHNPALAAVLSAVDDAAGHRYPWAFSGPSDPGRLAERSCSGTHQVKHGRPMRADEALEVLREARRSFELTADDYEAIYDRELVLA